jgi:hypothetical protein
MAPSWFDDGYLVGYAWMALGSLMFAGLYLRFPDLVDRLAARQPWRWRMSPRWKRISGYFFLFGAAYSIVALAVHITRCGGACYYSN